MRAAPGQRNCRLQVPCRRACNHREFRLEGKGVLQTDHPRIRPLRKIPVGIAHQNTNVGVGQRLPDQARVTAAHAAPAHHQHAPSQGKTA